MTRIVQSKCVPAPGKAERGLRAWNLWLVDNDEDNGDDEDDEGGNCEAPDRSVDAL